MCKIDGWWEPVIKYRKLSWVLCNDLEGWDGGVLKNLLQHHSSKASILQHSPFFTVQLSHPPMATGDLCRLVNRH